MEIRIAERKKPVKEKKPPRSMSIYEKTTVDRMDVLTILPPEAVVLKEKVVIRIDNIDDYLRVKDAIKIGSINKESILELL